MNAFILRDSGKGSKNAFAARLIEIQGSERIGVEQLAIFTNGERESSFELRAPELPQRRASIALED